MTEPILQTKDLRVTAGQRELLKAVSLAIPAGGVFGLMGPSGAGKSTLLKCLNRMTEMAAGLKVSGDILFHGQSIYRGTTPDELRSRIGILFQQPVVFPKSIKANVLFGVRHLGKVPRHEWSDTAEHALREAALWDEVKGRLSASALKLSVGQQQRLCLARTLATGPEVILMDEPTSALDPRSTAAIEELIQRLGATRTIVLVTHNTGQARRVCQRLAFITAVDGAGQCVAEGPAAEVFAHPAAAEFIAFSGA